MISASVALINKVQARNQSTNGTRRRCIRFPFGILDRWISGGLFPIPLEPGVVGAAGEFAEPTNAPEQNNLPREGGAVTEDVPPRYAGIEVDREEEDDATSPRSDGGERALDEFQTETTAGTVG